MAFEGTLATARAIGGALRQSDTTVESPEVSVADAFSARRQSWAVLEAWADGRAYDEQDWAYWASYKKRHNLPKYIRAVYNPVQRAVDWYAGHLYRGTWTEDGRPLPDGTPNLIPVPDDVWQARPLVVAAAFQALTWSNFRSVLPALVARTQLLGSQFVEIHDDLSGDPERRKVTAEVIPLWQVADVALNSRGDVKRYVLAFTTKDERGSYAFRKEVDNRETRWYRDDKLERTDRHGYGFCPGVWVVGRLRGSRVFGVSLVSATLGKIDRINALGAFAEAWIGKRLNEPRVFFGQNGKLHNIQEQQAVENARREALRTGDQGFLDRLGQLFGPSRPDRPSRVDATESGIRYLHWDGENGRVESLLGTMDLASVQARIDALIAEVEADLPEIVMDQQLRAMSQVTGPGAEGMIGDVRARYDETMGNLDTAVTKIMQMLVSIGCHRANGGDWDAPDGTLTRAQALFRITETVAVTDGDGNVTWQDSGVPVGLDSYARGAIALSISRRPLIEDVPPAEGTEAYERAMQMRSNWVTGLSAMTTTQWRRMGLSEEEITALTAEQAARDDLTILGFNQGAIQP